MATSDNSARTEENVTAVYSVSQKNPTPPRFSDIFTNGREFLVQTLHAYYTFHIYARLQIFFSYLKLRRSYAILSATTQRACRPMVF